MLFTLGINHRSAPLAIREQVCFQPKQLPQVLTELIDAPCVREAAILSTCNRTEVYCHTSTPEYLAQWLADYHRLEPNQIAPYLYALPQTEAVRHAFRVACGLDSMVLGEPQILGQMKEAVRAADAAGTLGPHLHKLFQRAFSVAKEVRSTTAISANIVSMAAACVHLCRRLATPLCELNVLFVGSGEMIELCATHFSAQKPRRISLASRNTEQATSLTQRFGGTVIPLNELGARLPDHDILVSCTASTTPLVTRSMVQKALHIRNQRPILMVDLAVPRDIAPEVAAEECALLYTVDDLASIVANGQESRQAAVQEAESIIHDQANRFDLWLERRNNVPLVRALRDSGERMRRHEIERALSLLASGKNPATVIEQLSQRLTNKLLHAPTTALNLAQGDAKAKLQTAAMRLFRLNQ